MGRAPCCDKAAVKRGPWSPEEDEALRSYVEQYGSGGNWIALPKKAGLRRCGKSCRLRWLNYLRPDIRHGGFTEEEDGIICSLYNKLGSKWSLIASHLKGRTDNDVKNYWNTKLKKRLLAAAASADATVAFRPAAAAPLAPMATHPALLPLAIPTIKTETYTCEDFLAPATVHEKFEGCADAVDGSAPASAASSASAATSSGWSTDNSGGGLFMDFGLGPDVVTTTEQLFGGFYYSLDPSLSSSTSIVSVFKE